MFQQIRNLLHLNKNKNAASSVRPVFYAFQLLVILTLAVFLAEARGFVHLPVLFGISSHTEMFLHTAVTTLLVFPFLLLLSYLPLLRQIERSTRAEAALQQAKETTEQRIQDSTAELLTANQSLQDEISRRRIVEQRLQLHTAALESAANGIVITDKQGLIQWCNLAFCTMTGYQSGEVLGHSLSFLKSGVHSQDYYQQLWNTILSGQVWHGETVNQRKDGRLYTEEQTITPLVNAKGEITHYIAIKNDITPRKMVEQALEVERKRLFTVLDRLPAIVYLKALDYKIRYANTYFRERFGEPDERLCYQVIYNHSQPCEHCPLPALLASQQTLAWEWTFPDGKTYHFYDYPFQDSDEGMLILQLGIDITERKQAEERMEHSNLQLERASQAERKQRQLAESLVQATLVLNTSLDQELVLDRILEQIQRAIPSAIAGVLLFDGDTVHLARSRGLEQVNDALAQLLDGVSLSALPLIQEICQERRARLFVDAQLEFRWSPLPGLEGVRAMILVPLVTVDQAVGMIGLVSERPGFYQSEQMELLQAFATPAALAIQNARLFQQVQAARERLQWLSRRLVDVQEQERRWIARELHDEAGQALTSLKVGLRLLGRQAQDPAAVHQAVVELNQVADGVLENLHRLAMDLRPASLDHLGLSAALRQDIETLAEQHEMQFNYEVIHVEQRLPPEVETTLYRIVQEALTNIIRHAHATHVDVLLERRDKKVIALIEDNGVGFDPQTTLQSNRLGLLGMRERVEMLGGALSVDSQPGEGTAIFVEVPLDD